MRAPPAARPRPPRLPEGQGQRLQPLSFQTRGLSWGSGGEREAILLRVC